MILNELQQLYASHPNVEAVRRLLDNPSIHHIYCGGLCASSASLFSSVLVGQGRRPYVFILGDLEEAGYFYHDLVQVLGDANVQLRALSRRYRLERVPGTLALQVVDQDMCDEVRSVHSLSGGESFLVSLALALGLSSLSSNRMKVESLFIDEGFGALDAETLRVAMDALESLHTQGRKIGVISHVQEMTERIAVRIQVHRMGNGRSYIEVQS